MIVEIRTRGRRPVRDSKLPVDAHEVVLHRVHAHPESLRQLPVAEAMRQKLEDLRLTRR